MNIVIIPSFVTPRFFSGTPECTSGIGTHRIGLLGKRMQRHLCPRRNAVDFKLGFPQEPAVGVVDIRLAQGRDLRRNNALRAPDAFALLYIHPVPGLMRRSTTIVSESIRPSLVFLSSAQKTWSQFYDIVNVHFVQVISNDAELEEVGCVCDAILRDLVYI